MRYVNRDPDGRYSLTKEIICDPHHGVVLQHVRLEGREDLVPRLKVYALLAPHLDGGGAGNSARALDLAGHKVLLAWKNEWSLAMTASCGFSRVSCGFVGASDGWQDLMQNFTMDWEFGSATDGNIAVMGEIDLGCIAQRAIDARLKLGEAPSPEAQSGNAVREFTLAIGIGEGHHTALQKTMGSLATPFEEQRKRFIVQWQRAANPEWLAAQAQDGGKLMRASHTVLLAHEDKIVFGRVCGVGFDSVGPGEGRRRPGRLPPGVDARHGADGDGAAGLRARGDGAAGAGLPGVHAAARRRICAEFLDRRNALLEREATG